MVDLPLPPRWLGRSVPVPWRPCRASRHTKGRPGVGCKPGPVDWTESGEARARTPSTRGRDVTFLPGTRMWSLNLGVSFPHRVQFSIFIAARERLGVAGVLGHGLAVRLPVHHLRPDVIGGHRLVGQVRAAHPCRSGPPDSGHSALGPLDALAGQNRPHLGLGSRGWPHAGGMQITQVALGRAVYHSKFHVSASEP